VAYGILNHYDMIQINVNCVHYLELFEPLYHLHIFFFIMWRYYRYACEGSEIVTDICLFFSCWCEKKCYCICAMMFCVSKLSQLISLPGTFLSLFCVTNAIFLSVLVVQMIALHIRSVLYLVLLFLFVIIHHRNKY
jgi:hypothetical protein